MSSVALPFRLTCSFTPASCLSLKGWHTNLFFDHFLFDLFYHSFLPPPFFHMFRKTKTNTDSIHFIYIADWALSSPSRNSFHILTNIEFEIFLFVDTHLFQGHFHVAQRYFSSRSLPLTFRELLSCNIISYPLTMNYVWMVSAWVSEWNT